MKEKLINDLRRGFLYTSVFKYLYYLINLLVTAILARILTPADFGVVAMITLFVTFFYLISNFGIGPSIIQNQELNEFDNFSIFIITLIIAFPISAIFFF